MKDSFQKIYSTLTLILLGLVYSIQRRDAGEIAKIRQQLGQLKAAASTNPDIIIPASRSANSTAPTTIPAEAPLAPPQESAATVPVPDVGAGEASGTMQRFIKAQMMEMELQTIKEALSISPEQEAKIRDYLTTNTTNPMDDAEGFDLEQHKKRQEDKKLALGEILGVENYEAVENYRKDKFQQMFKEQQERRDAFWQKKLTLTDEQKGAFSEMLEAARSDAMEGDEHLNVKDMLTNPDKALEYRKQVIKRSFELLQERSKDLLNEEQQKLLRELSEQDTSPFSAEHTPF